MYVCMCVCVIKIEYYICYPWGLANNEHNININNTKKTYIVANINTYNVYYKNRRCTLMYITMPIWCRCNVEICLIFYMIHAY